VKRVKDKIALVTGAARGQGRSHVVRLAQEAADVIAIDICRPVEGVGYAMATPEDLRLTEKLADEQGAKVVSAEIDIRDEQALSQAVEAAVKRLGRLDIVVANAGVAAIAQFDDFSRAQ
jgi:NAD(P)-dependent dehydrogenase (short-subunit alcohol dehydrogenase family)